MENKSTLGFLFAAITLIYGLGADTIAYFGWLYPEPRPVPTTETIPSREESGSAPSYDADTMSAQVEAYDTSIIAQAVDTATKDTKTSITKFKDYTIEESVLVQDIVQDKDTGNEYGVFEFRAMENTCRRMHLYIGEEYIATIKPYDNSDTVTVYQKRLKPGNYRVTALDYWGQKIVADLEAKNNTRTSISIFSPPSPSARGLSRVYFLPKSPNVQHEVVVNGHYVGKTNSELMAYGKPVDERMHLYVDLVPKHYRCSVKLVTNSGDQYEHMLEFDVPKDSVLRVRLSEPPPRTRSRSLL